MSFMHAVVWLDHHSAKILQFNAEEVHSTSLKAHSHPTRQHGSAVRSEHEFYAELCDAIRPVPAVLLTGAGTALDDFRHYLLKHRAALAPQIAGYETVDHPSDAQLVALARPFFLKRDRMNGVPTPT